MKPLYMLDTNIVSALARDPHGMAASKIASVKPEAICVSVVTAAELRFGCAKKGSPRLTAQINAILDAIPILAFDVPADATYGRVRASLESAGTPIGPNDLLIAAHALTIGATLVTANIDEFRRVSGLRVENWLS